MKNDFSNAVFSKKKEEFRQQIRQKKSSQIFAKKRIFLQENPLNYE